MSHLDKSGKYVNEEQSEKIKDIFLTLEVFQLEISGNVNNEEHSENM